LPQNVTATSSCSPTPTPTQSRLLSISNTPRASASERQQLPVPQASSSALPGSSSLSAALLFRGFPSDAFVSESALLLLESSIANAVQDSVQGTDFAMVFIIEILDKNDSFIIYSRSAVSGRRLFTARALSQTSSLPTDEGIAVRFVVLLPPSTSSLNANADVLLQLSSSMNSGSNLFASMVISKMQSEAATSSNTDLILFATSSGVSASTVTAVAPSIAAEDPNAGPFDKIGGVSGLTGIVCAGAFMVVIVIALAVVAHKASKSMERQEKMMRTEHMRSNGSLRTVSINTVDSAVANTVDNNNKNHSQNHSLSLSAISVELMEENPTSSTGKSQPLSAPSLPAVAS